MSDRRMVLLSAAALLPLAVESAAAAWQVSPGERTNQTPHLSAQAAKTYYGKYRGTVVNNIDPQQIGRIVAQVPAVLGATPSAWALPCCPGAGHHAGVFAIPPAGAHVWIEFEGGDPDKPIWSGGFWSTASDVPAPASTGGAPTPPIVIETAGQNGITISDMPGPMGGIVIKSTSGASIIVNDTGIYIQNGKGAVVTLIGPAVTINNKQTFI